MSTITDQTERCKCGRKSIEDAKIEQFAAVLDAQGSLRLDDWGYRSMKLYGLTRSEVDLAVGHLKEQGRVTVEPEWNGLRVSCTEEAFACRA